MPLTVLETHPTPNPNAMKYVVSSTIAGDTPLSFTSAEQARGDPIASEIFKIPGVVGVMMLHDFITISKTPSAKWGAISVGVKKVVKAARV